MKKIRFGVIGCGSIANEYHLPALRRVEGAQLVWACDLIEERAQKAKDDFGFEKYTLDYHDILNDSSIDAVCIFTKIEMHATLCIEAAAAGKHIFSQKPFAYNIEEGRKIIRAVDEAGVKLTPSFMHSYMDGSIAARRIVEEGKIGEIRHIRMRNATKNPFDSAPGYGGCMMDIGCHGMDLIHTVAGSSIEEVFALHLSPRDEKRREEFGERANLNGVENTAILNYRLASGATVFHEVFWTQVAQTNRFEMEIYGAKGVIYLYNPHRSDIVYYGWNLDGHPRKDIHWQAAPVDPQFFGYMLDTAAATGRTLGVIFQNRYNAGSQLIRRCLDNGDLGEVRAARVLLTWDRSPEYYSQSDWKGTWDKEGGGVIIDQAIHTLDLMRWFIGRPVTGVQASLANRTHPDIPVEDTAEGRVEFEGGAYGAFYVMNHYCTDEPVRLELACTRGKAVMEGPKARVELNNGLTCLADNDPTQMFEYGDVKQYWGTSHVKQIGNFYQSLLGLAPMYVTAENAFLTQEMICALYEHGRRHFVREVR